MLTSLYLERSVHGPGRVYPPPHESARRLDPAEEGAIRKAIDALNQGTTRLAELMMDSAVSTALKGKTMDEADMGEGPMAPHPVAKAFVRQSGPAPIQSPSLWADPAVCPARSICNDPVGSSSFAAAVRSFRLPPS